MMKKWEVFSKKSNLDEYQEQELLKIEHTGCWMAFWGLFAAMVIQMIMCGKDIQEGLNRVAGEWFIFMILSIYLAIACNQKGIWDRRIKASTSTNVICSLVAGLFGFAYAAITACVRYPGKYEGAIAAGIFMGGFIFVLTLVVLELSRVSYEKKKKELEEEPSDEQ